MKNSSLVTLAYKIPLLEKKIQNREKITSYQNPVQFFPFVAIKGIRNRTLNVIIDNDGK